MSRSIFVASMLLLRLLSSGSVHAQRVEKPPLWEGLPLSSYPVRLPRCYAVLASYNADPEPY